MKHITLDEISDKLEFFEKMYDAVRLVDPVKKRVLESRNKSLCETAVVCYDYWNNGVVCDNCISIRAFLQDESFVKLECNGDIFILVTSLPIKNSGLPVVLELLRNATDTMLIGSGNHDGRHDSGQLFHGFVRGVDELILRDAGTGLFNRRYVEERLPADIVGATLNKTPLSVCFIDIDKFKSINDRFGHDTGDLALRAVGGAITGSIRSGRDWAARYGGDEFLVCLSDTDEDQARIVAGRILHNISQISIGNIGCDGTLSISIGIETMEGGPVGAEELIAGADRKMYAEKRKKDAGSAIAAGTE